MSIKPTPTPTRPEPQTIQDQFTIGNAPRTFDPFNTHDCPGMFADKWQDNGDGPATQE